MRDYKTNGTDRILRCFKLGWQQLEGIFRCMKAKNIYDVLLAESIDVTVHFVNRNVSLLNFELGGESPSSFTDSTLNQTDCKTEKFYEDNFHTFKRKEFETDGQNRQKLKIKAHELFWYDY